MKNNWDKKDFIFLFVGMVFVILLNYSVDEYRIYYHDNHIYGKEMNHSEIQIENKYWYDNQGNNQTTEPTLIPTVIPTANLDEYNNYDPIYPNDRKKGNWMVCKGEAKTYGSPEARPEWQTGELYNGAIVTFVTVENGHWALIALNPIQYIDMINLCKMN